MTPGPPGPGTTTPPATPPVVAPGGGSTPAPGGGGSTSPSTPAPDTTQYDAVGAFKVTSLSPNRVSTAGGTLVTVTGLALPASPTIRIGATATATVLISSATKVVFRVPARTADSYDVSIFAAGGTSQVLSRALTYYDPSAGSTPEDPADSGSGATPAPGGGTTPAPGGGTTPAPGGGGPSPVTEPVVRKGPSGERLVRSAKFGALRSIWSVDCSSSCAGVAI
ncbi:hypothetical protein E4P40_27690 [Blastococcus sp. CT_GayMR20]|nr:hypothetical protein E4P40_27690 [Blastococcus sp. CT_GayMR20]